MEDHLHDLLSIFLKTMVSALSRQNLFELSLSTVRDVKQVFPVFRVDPDFPANLDLSDTNLLNLKVIWLFQVFRAQLFLLP